jgi:hypothetical protein
MELIPRSWRSVCLDAFDLYAQQYVLFETVLLTVIHAKVSAVESAAGIRSADLLLEHGMLDAFEGIYAERYGLGDAVKGQDTGHGFWRAVCEFNESSFVFRSRIFRHIEYLGARYMFVELVVGEIDRCGVDEHIDRSCFGLGINGDGTAGFLECTAPRGQPPEMVHLETRVGVVRINVVGSRGGSCGCDRPCQEQQRVIVFHSDPLQEWLSVECYRNTPALRS